MSRIIREHHVFGKPVREIASSELEARAKVELNNPGRYIWDIKRVNGTLNLWEAYIARHEDCFATND